MKIALIQLSDIHLVEKATENPVLLRHAEIVSAVGAVCTEAEHLILVISGDTAYSGKPQEYEHGQSLITQIREGLVRRLSIQEITVLTVAGNHDCDFKSSTSVRATLLESLKPERIDVDFIRECVSVQREYVTFANKFCTQTSLTLTTQLDSIYRQQLMEMGEKKVMFHLLNSAWMSQLKEKPGQMYYPIQIIRDRITDSPTADLAVAVLHHPFNWYWPENGRELRQCLEDNADMILTGHEHVPSSYSKQVDTGEQNEYLEGGVLQETGKPHTSSFNVVLFDTDGKQQKSYRFVWQSDQYIVEGEPYWRPFERNKRLTKHQFVFRQEFLSWLDDPGAGYTHPHKDLLMLSDIFIYPDLQEVQYEQDSKMGAMIRSGDVLGYVQNHKYLIIVADEKAGKTALAKSLTKDLHKNGQITIFLSGDALDANLGGDQVTQIINDKLREQFGENFSDRFWQLDSTKRAVVIDDIHKFSANRKGKSVLIDLLVVRFGIVVIFAGEEFHIEELAIPQPTNSSILKFKQCSVLQFGHLLRHRLISKWCWLGREHAADEAQVERTVRRAEEQISRIISIDFLPSYPVFVLILLQQLESTAKLTTTSGSFGHLYEVLVTASLARQKTLRDDMDAIYTYLSEFAYYLFKNEKRAIPESEVMAWHNIHCKEYRLSIDFGSRWQELSISSIIDARMGEYKFRYKYLYYFFVARYFRDNINKSDIQTHIETLSSKLFQERAANIMIFLCHLSKDERVLTAMLNAAKRLFSNEPMFDVSQQGEFLNRAITELPKLVLDAKNPKENREQMLEFRDEVERRTDNVKNPDTKEEDDLKSQTDNGATDEKINEMLLYPAAFKTIQILGQVLKNFSGSLKGEAKRELVQQCYSLGLRVLGNIFSVAEKGLPELVAALTKRAENEQKVQRLFFGLLQIVAYNTFKHVSDSVGCERVLLTFDEVVVEVDNPSIRVIDLSIRLDYGQEFPRNQISKLAKEFESNFFAFGLVRQMVWYHLYMFHVDRSTKQSVCQQLRITTEQQTKLLTPPVKKMSKPRAKTADQNRAKKKKRRKK